MTDEGPRVEALLRALEAESHPATTVIFKEADGADARYGVERGRVRVSVRATGRERTITQLGARRRSPAWP